MSDISSVTQDLNNILSFFEEGCSKRGLSSEIRRWADPKEPEETFALFVLKYRGPSFQKLPKKEKKFGKLYAGFTKNQAQFWVDLNGVLKEFKSLRNQNGFIAELIHIFWYQQPMTEDKLQGLVDKYYAPYATKVSNALFSWILSSNFKQSGKIGAKLYRYRKFIPDEFKKAPSDILYRAMEIDNSLFEKLKTGEKKHLGLKDRIYSSWTWDLYSAKEFAEKHKYHAKTDNKTLTVMRKRFREDQIFLNVYTAAQYYGEHTDFSKDEKEVIIRSPSGLKFSSKDIYLYWEGNRWKEFSKI